MSSVNHKAIGGILLLVGTSIGAGMLALPIALAQVGFYYSVALAFTCWLIMYLGARFILEINLTLKPGSHLVSMAQATLGKMGAVITWISCLCLMYTLLAGYIAGGSDVFKNFFDQLGMGLPAHVSTVLFTLFFGSIVYAGVRFVDYSNRLLMFGKLGIFILVVSLMLPHTHLSFLTNGTIAAIPSSLMILITSFGFASIVPSLRYYFQDDVVLLKKVIFWGSLIPFFCYIVWLLAIMSILPQEGPHSLFSISQMSQPLSGFIESLQAEMGTGWIAKCFTIFTIICLLTAFLGVSLGLFDFMADGLSLKKRGWSGGVVFALTFFPPMLLVLIYPGVYLHALNYAGRFCVLLLLILPALMLWRAPSHIQKTAAGGKWGILIVLIFGFFLLYLGD